MFSVGVFCLADPIGAAGLIPGWAGHERVECAIRRLLLGQEARQRLPIGEATAPALALSSHERLGEFGHVKGHLEVQWVDRRACEGRIKVQDAARREVTAVVVRPA